MNVSAPFSDATYDPGFSPEVTALIPHMMQSVSLPGTWALVTKEHRYATANHIRLAQSDDNVWGVPMKRNIEQAQAELIIPRLAYPARVPVAPTFLTPTQPKPHAQVLSVIPFEEVIHDYGFPFERMTAYLKHFASTLPFMLSIGAKSDRSNPTNRCIDAKNPTHIAEFDFATSDVKRLLEINGDYAQSYRLNAEYIAKIYALMTKENYADDVAQQLHRGFFQFPRKEFEEGLQNLKAVPDSAVADVITLVDNALPLRAEQKQRLTEFLGVRKAGVLASYTQGHFDPLLVDELPISRHTDGKMVQEYLSKGVYRFAA